MSKKPVNKRRKFHWKKHKSLYIVTTVLLAFPLLVGYIYALPLPRVIDVESGDLLAFYGTAFGILGSFYTYRMEKEKEKRAKEKESKPQLQIKVTAKDEDVFEVNVINYTQNLLSAIFLYDEFAGEELKSRYMICFDKKPDEYNEMKKNIPGLINIVTCEELIESDGYPKYIQICCDNANGDMWNCCFDKRKEGDRMYYYPNFELV